MRRPELFGVVSLVALEKGRIIGAWDDAQRSVNQPEDSQAEEKNDEGDTEHTET